MIRPKNECIDCKCFASLILDYEIPASSYEKAGEFLADGLSVEGVARITERPEA